MATPGIDISNYQGNISDLGSDIEFVIIKVTEGASYVNPYWQEQRDTARRDGKVVLYYHFSNLGSTQAESQHFLSTVGQLGHGEGIALDWETGNYSDGIDAWCAEFTNYCKQATGVTAMLYSNAARINSGSWPRMVALHAPLWEAAYASSAPSPHPFPSITIWQNTSSGSEQGVGGSVDRDIFYGTKEQLMQLGYGGNIEMVSKEAAEVEYRIAYPNEPLSTDFVKTWTGQVYDDMLTWVVNDKSRQDLVTGLVNDAAAYRQLPAQDKEVNVLGQALLKLLNTLGYKKQ